MTLSELYDELAGVQATGGVVERRRAPGCPLDLFAFAEKPSNRLGFRIGLPLAALSDGQEMPSLRGLLLARKNQADGVSLVLTAASPAFHDVFVALVEDLIAQAEHETDRDRAASALLGRLRKWQMFLKNLPPEGLGPEAQRGLFGELWVLGRQVLPCETPAEAVRAWTGPFATGKDFQFESGSVEVKTNIASGDQRLKINGERQLDDLGLAALLLAHLSLEPLQETGETLPERVAAVRTQCAGDFAAVQALEDRLREVGYWDVHEGLYRRPGYLVREFHLFEVREGFPRLTEADLLPGTGNVTYYITLSACEPFRVDEARLRALWEATHE